MYLRLQDARDLRFNDGSRVTSAAEYLGWHTSQILERGVSRVCAHQATPVAYVNHGRWLANCLHCGGAMLTHREWHLACCGECGSVYAQVLFPDEASSIEAVLLRRPTSASQNWTPGETIEMLTDENSQHGV